MRRPVLIAAAGRLLEHTREIDQELVAIERPSELGAPKLGSAKDPR